jgi:hypothetical protein
MNEFDEEMNLKEEACHIATLPPSDIWKDSKPKKRSLNFFKEKGFL